MQNPGRLRRYDLEANPLMVRKISRNKAKAVIRFQLSQPRQLEPRIVVVIQVVEADDFLAGQQQCFRDMVADEARRPGDKNSQLRPP